MGHGFSKRGSVDLCFSSETLSVVYRDNGDLSEMRACFTFNKASSATLMMKIVLCSSKFHVKCISILHNPRISFTGWAFRPLPCIPCRVLVRGLPVLLSPHSWCVSFYDILAIVKQSNSAS